MPVSTFSRCTPLYVLDLGRQMPASARVERHMSNRVRKQSGETQSIAHGEGVTLAVHVRDMCVDDAMLEVHAVKKGRVREAPPGTAGACARLSRQLQVDTAEPWARRSVFSILAMMDRYRISPVAMEREQIVYSVLLTLAHSRKGSMPVHSAHLLLLPAHSLPIKRAYVAP